MCVCVCTEQRRLRVMTLPGDFVICGAALRELCLIVSLESVVVVCTRSMQLRFAHARADEMGYHRSRVVD